MDRKPIQYTEIDMELLTEMLNKHNDVKVNIPTRHANACNRLLSVAHDFSHLKSGNGPSTIIKLIHGLWVTFTVLILHSKLIELAPFYVNSELKTFKLTKLDNETFELYCHK